MTPPFFFGSLGAPLKAPNTQQTPEGVPRAQVPGLSSQGGYSRQMRGGQHKRLAWRGARVWVQVGPAFPV